MERVYRFPVPRDERILLLVAAVVTPGLLCALFFVIRDVAAASELSVGTLMAMSQRLRAATAGIVALVVFGALGLLSYFRVKNGATLRVAETVRFQRPGVPIFGWFARDVSVDAARVDSVTIGKERVGATERVALRLTAGHEEIVVNLSHAQEEGGQRTSGAEIARDAWLDQPLVAAIIDATDQEVRIV